MKILHIDTERTWRGGQQQVFSLIQGLAKRGHHNHAVVSKGGPLAIRLKELGLCQLMEIHPLGELDLISAHFVNRKIKKDQIEIIHAHSGHGVAMAALARIGTTVPYVLTRRVDFPVGHNILSRWKYNGAAAIAAISTGVKDVLLKSGVDPKKIFLVPSGVDFQKFKNVQPIPKDFFGFAKGTLIVGQIAALAPHKDQNTFVEAISILRKKNISVGGVIIGEGPSRQSVEEKILKLGLVDNVILLGHKHNPLDFLASFDVFCMSSNAEGLGTSLIDAMVLRIPVVATNVGGIPDLVEDGRTGWLCSPLNPEFLAETLQKALSAKNKDDVLAQAHQKAQNFDVLRTIEATEAMYRTVYPQSFPHN